MKKSKLLLALLLCLFLSGCGKANAGPNTSKKTNGNEIVAQEETTQNYPTVNDIAIELLPTKGVNGLQEIKVTNNSKFPISGVNINYLSNDNEINAVASNTLLPGESETEEIFSADNEVKEITNDYKPVKMSFTFLDNDKNKYMLTYDYKLNMYDVVQYN